MTKHILVDSIRKSEFLYTPSYWKHIGQSHRQDSGCFVYSYNFKKIYFIGGETEWDF